MRRRYIDERSIEKAGEEPQAVYEKPPPEEVPEILRIPAMAS